MEHDDLTRQFDQEARAILMVDLNKLMNWLEQTGTSREECFRVIRGVAQCAVSPRETRERRLPPAQVAYDERLGWLEKYCEQRPVRPWNDFLVEKVGENSLHVRNTAQKDDSPKWRANCNGLDLSKLEGKEVSNLDFSKSYFEGANFTEVNVANTSFFRTRLNNATLTGVKNLTVDQLGRAKFDFLSAKDPKTRKLIDATLEIKTKLDFFYYVKKCGTFSGFLLKMRMNPRFQEKVRALLDDPTLTQESLACCLGGQV